MVDEFRDYYQLMNRKPKKEYSITTVLVIINCAVFFLAMIAELIKPGFFSLLAFSPSDFLSGKNVWTLATSMFMHGNIGHLLVNMITLLSMGALLERMIGKKKFLITYFAAGLFGSLVMVILYLISSDPRVILLSIFNTNINVADIVAVGASGAIFGIIGMLLILRPRLPIMVMFIPIGIPLIYATIGLFILFSFISWVANSAHLGGLLVGLFLGWFWFKRNARIRRLFLMRNSNF